MFRPISVISLERVRVKKGEKPKKKFIETASTHWQIRFDCGDIRTLPDKTGLKTLHHLLGLDRAKSLTPEAALLIEPKSEKGDTASTVTPEDPVAEYFESKGIPWRSMDETARNNLIQAALARILHRYVELRDLQEEDDLSPNEEDDLNAIIKDLGPLVPVAETAYSRLRSTNTGPEAEEGLGASATIQQDLHVAGGNYERRGGQRGEDSPDAQAFRARMKRVKDSLRENGFAAFADHLDDYLTSTGASWSYNPPQGIEWTT